MRLALLILTSLSIFTLLVGYLALIDVFDPIGVKGIFASTMGLLFFGTGLLWVIWIEREKAVKNLEVYTRIHSISGLTNRNEFLKFLEEQVKNARRHRSPYGIILIGIDGFREINNRMGHSGGDIILKHVGERIQSVTRSDDIAGHYEGDTFIIGASHADIDGTRKLASRVHDIVTREPYKTKGVSTELRVSIALAAAPPEDYDPEVLLFKVDGRLKKAKAAGGNRIQYEDITA